MTDFFSHFPTDNDIIVQMRPATSTSCASSVRSVRCSNAPKNSTTRRPRAFRVCAEKDDTPGAPSSPSQSSSEDLIARLKAAEQEAKQLKQKLEAVNQMNQASTGSQPTTSTATSRIDGADLRRETLSFVENKPRNWLSESDIEFFTGGGPSELEEGGEDLHREDSSGSIDRLVQRRLIIGVSLSAALGAFALVPTEQLQPPPSKPLFFYLVPLLRVRSLLDEVLAVAGEGDYEQMSRLLSQIEGPPNNVQQNLKSASASLASSDGRLAQRADALGRDVYEYLKGVDYQTYFESRVGRGGGEREREFFEYSTSSAKAAVGKLEEFLRLMPEDQLEAAKEVNSNSGGL